MLPKRARLTTSEVSEVLSKGTSVFFSTQKGQKSLISVKFLASVGTFKSAAVVSKSVARAATERNRLRRAVYRAIANSNIPKKPGNAIIFVKNIPKGPLTPAFEEEISIFFDKISLL